MFHKRNRTVKGFVALAINGQKKEEKICQKIKRPAQQTSEKKNKG
jgi:hypothetical protein